MSKLLVFLISACLAVALHLPVQSQETSPLGLALQAQELYRAGKSVPSATMWQRAVSAYQELGDRPKAAKSAINQAQVLQDLGLYPKACKVLLNALEVENPSCDRQQIDQLVARFEAKNKVSRVQGIGLRSLGSVLHHQGVLIPARQLLKLSERAATNSEELAKTLLVSSNIERSLGDQTRDRLSYDKITEVIDRQDPNLALKPYLKAFVAYEQAAVEQKADSLTKIQAQLNYLDLLIDIQDWWQNQTTRRTRIWQKQQQTSLVEAGNNFSKSLEFKLDNTGQSLISTIDRHWNQVSPSHSSIYARINYTRSLNRLGQTEQVKTILDTTLAEARAIADPLGESYTLGYLGQYYGQQGELEQAIVLTNQALTLAQAQNITGDAREVTYLWQSQLGQLLEQQHKTTEAIAAYTSAFNTLQSLRSDLNANNQVVQFDFRQEVKPVYLRLANLLLEENSPQASKSLNLTSNTKNNWDNSNLELARQIIESLQLAELDNFFQDPCVQTADTTVTIDQIDSQAAVIYPIVLRDRLEVILSLPNQPLQKFSTAISETQVNQTIDLLYNSLYNPSVDQSAVNIFSTTPIEPTEVRENMQTLLPTLQQLHSWLIEPLTSELTTNQVKTLVFVLNGRLQNVPLSALYDGKQYLLEKYQVVLAPSLQLLAPQATSRDKTKVLTAGLSQQVEVAGEIFPALNNVPQELNQIKAIFPQSHQLLNREFTQANLKEQLQFDFSVIHLATHGLFSSDPSRTFIITGDHQIIDIDTLGSILKSSQTRPELIVLSACDTATGDERAILGLAGMAVRSQISSTIASLWSVSDDSTTKLMSQFYQRYQNSSTTKVSALRQAQLSLIDSLRANPPNSDLADLPPHPYSWAAYVLVGNWL